MPDTIVPRTPTSSALSAEHYQTYEMALEHDDVLSGDDIAQIRSYAAYARAQAQVFHKTIAAISGIDDVATIKAEATETAQTYAKVGIYADQRIGELLRELPTKAGKRTDLTSSDTQEEVTKASALADAGISKTQAYDLQALAANPDVVQAVLDKAEKDGTIPSRAQVLKAIKERDEATAREEDLKSDLADAYKEIDALERQNDQLYEQAHPEPKVVTREVTREVAPPDYESIKRERDVYLADVQKLRERNEDMRRELDKAKDLLGMDKSLQDIRKDVQYLIAATNQYMRQYGGLTWTAASFDQVDTATLLELRKAAINLATFANALVASLEDFNG